jgi:hypothetical protein
VGPTCQPGKQREKEIKIPVQLDQAGRCCWARLVCLGPIRFLPFFVLFLFLFSVFLISFISFAYLVQIASNQLCKVSKIQKQHSKTVTTMFS